MMKTELTYQLIWMSRPLMQAAEASVEKGLKGTGLTVRMRAVLEVLHVHGDATVPDIALKLEINRQYVQLMVNETLAEGLTERRPNPRHRSSALLCLTDKGRGLIEAVIANEKSFVQSIGADIDASEVETALKVVSTLIEKLKLDANE
jgi:DNA-binding MarR family transcriptional regulator